jgi:hypothetical protein
MLAKMGIVKGMLQHSRSSTGIKEPTSIINLADEYLRLAFHGLRQKTNHLMLLLPLTLIIPRE